MPNEQRYWLILGTKPETCRPEHVAVILATSAHLATVCEGLGLDPTSIEVTFTVPGGQRIHWKLGHETP